DRQFVPVHVSVQTAPNDGNTIQRLSLFELSELTMVESHLQVALAHWSALVQNAPDVIMTVERSGRIAFINRSVWGCSVQDLAGTQITDYVSRKEQPKIEQCLKKTFENGQRTTCEIKDVNGDADAWFSFTFGPARSPGSPLPTTTVIIRE